MRYLILVFLLFAGCGKEDRILVPVKSETITASNRVALVFGNGTYDSIGDLDNPTNDSRDVREKLEDLDFQVFYLENGTLEQMEAKLYEFEKSFSKDTVALFYYAGHGVENGGENFLIAKDSVVNSKADLKYRTFRLNRLLEGFNVSENKLNVAILDACRDNPFRNLRNTGKGLATAGATGTLIAYATASGETAEDGTGENGLFTKHLLNHIDRSDVELEQMFKDVGTDVSKESKGTQNPWRNSSISGNFYLRGDGNGESDEVRKLKEQLAESERKRKEAEAELKTVTSRETRAGTLQKETDSYRIYKDVFVDKKTNLMWQKNGDGKKYTWQEAMRYCESLNLSGYSGWRLPNRDEAKSLLTEYYGEWDYYEKWNRWFNKNKHKIHNDKFVKNEISQLSLHWIWTSTKYSENSVNSWIVSFESGNDDWVSQADSELVVCVRGL
jgi:hypothetical protein